MTKKKSKKTTSQGPRMSMMESLGIKNIIQIFQNERLRFFLGVVLFALSICLTWAFVSFFTTGAADQSIIENLREGDLDNEPQKFANTVGSLGAYAAYFFMNRCFGVAAFGVPLFSFLISLAMMKVYRPSSYGAPTGHRHYDLAMSGQHRSHSKKRRPHLLHEISVAFAGYYFGRTDPDGALFSIINLCSVLEEHLLHNVDICEIGNVLDHAGV